MAGLYPAIHVKPIMRRKTWMPIAVSTKPLAAAGTAFPREPGTSPVMTAEFPDERSLLSS
jgi:hypothetical protein